MNAVYVGTHPANFSAVPNRISHAGAKTSVTGETMKRDVVVERRNQGKESLFVVKWKDAGRPQRGRGKRDLGLPKQHA
jgi:hypothetical protein